MAADLDTAGCAETMRALGDETRLRLVEVLLRGPMHVGELAAALGLPPYQASRHLGVLRAAGLVVAERDGKAVRYRVSPEVRATRTAGIDLGCCAIRFPRE